MSGVQYGEHEHSASAADVTSHQLEFLALNPLAMVDHVSATLQPNQVKSLLGDGELGGSKRISSTQLTDILSQVRCT